MAKLSVQPGILDIQPYVPGRSEAAGGRRLIKLSSNETPLGTSKKAIAAYRGLAGQLHRYPDGGSEALRNAIGRRHGLDPARILCGNGSDELLSLLAQAYAGPGGDVLFTTHAFAVYKIAAQSVGARPVIVPETDLTADVDALIAHAGSQARICYLANPNNPTGTYVDTDSLKRLRDGLPDGCLLVIDAAYAEYVTRNDYSAGVELVDGYDNVVMTRTFSKIYGLSALRLGWLYGSREIVDVLNRIRGPFNVNAAAQAAGIAALDDPAFIDQAVAHNNRWLPWLEREIAGLGLTVHPSAANFVLIGFPGTAEHNADRALDYMMRRGIIPRPMTGYGLPDCLRFSLGLADDNRFVVQTLRDFLAGEPADERVTSRHPSNSED